MRAAYIENTEEWVSDFSFSTKVTVRFSETDMYGHLNNTFVFTYFEYARIEFFKSLGTMAEWLDPKGKRVPVVADLQCDYVKQVFFDETITIYVKADSIGSSSVDLHYMGKNEKEEIVFTGRGTIVQIDLQTGRPIPWTEIERETFKGKL